MSYRNYRPGGFGGFNLLPKGVKNLLIVNGLFFLATLVFEISLKIDLRDILGLHYWTAPDFEIYQVFSHMFMHGDFMHLFFNMFALWMFGVALENVWGPKRFVFFYFFTALGAAFLYQTVIGIEFYRIQSAIDTFKNMPTLSNLQDGMRMLNASLQTTSMDYLMSTYKAGDVFNANDMQQGVTLLSNLFQHRIAGQNVVGASGAVFGILVAFAMYYPNTELRVYLLLPIKAKYFVAIYAAIELYSGIQNNPNDNIAHFAHLGGALFGFILVKYWNKNNRKTLY